MKVIKIKFETHYSYKGEEREYRSGGPGVKTSVFIPEDSFTTDGLISAVLNCKDVYGSAYIPASKITIKSYEDCKDIIFEDTGGRKVRHTIDMADCEEIEIEEVEGDEVEK